MNVRFGLVVAALATVVLVASENQSLAGRRHRGGCSSCGSACSTCTVPAEAPAAPAEKEAAKAPLSSSPEVAKSDAEKAAAPTVTSAPESRNYSASRRGWRGRRWR
jgi:hypothetical protein